MDSMFGCGTFAGFRFPLASLPKDRKTKPNEATVNNALGFNQIMGNWRKRSHGFYPALFHAVTGVLAPIFEKLLPNARPPDCRFGKRPGRGKRSQTKPRGLTLLRCMRWLEFGENEATAFILIPVNGLRRFYPPFSTTCYRWQASRSPTLNWGVS
jgi:hypothetical protein